MAKSKSKPVKDLKPAEYEQLGRLMADVYENNYANRGRMFKMTFIKGVLTGFGSVLGATIVVALVLWVLSLFEQVPLIGPLLEKLSDPVSR